MGPSAGGIGVHVVDGIYANESEVSLAVLWGSDLTGDLVAGAESKPADLGLRDVDVVYAGRFALRLEEAVAVVGDGEDSAGEKVAAVLLGNVLEESIEQGLASGAGAVLEQAELAGHFEKLMIGLFLEFGDIHRVLRGNCVWSAGYSRKSGREGWVAGRLFVP